MKTAERHHARRVSVPSGQGVRVEKTITIERPTAVIYAFWRQLENLPRFMRHLDSVSVQDDFHSHWTAKALGGKLVEWDAEIIEQRENEMISWRSLPGSEIENAGSVWFTPILGKRGTRLRVELKYNPPAGKTGDLIARLFGRDAKSALDEDLGRMKCLLETGELPESHRGPGWGKKAADAIQNAAKATDRRVNQNPWSAVLATAGACFVGGLVLGGWVLAGRRKS